MRKAFTMLELIFVIVIIGILSTMGTDIFMHMYTAYYESKVQNELQNKTELAIGQISNRLTYRVKSSLIIHNVTANTFTPLESSVGVEGSLEWIGYDNDSFRGRSTDNSLASNYLIPGWSGFIDLDSSTGTALVSPGGNTTFAAEFIYSLSYGDINITNGAAGNNTAVVIFPDASGITADFGWYGSSTNNVHPIFTPSDSIFSSTTSNFFGVQNEVYENYQLAFSAYGLELTDGNLTLHYNYQPWNGETYATHGNSSLLLEDVSTLQFVQVGNLLKLQLCVNSPEVFGDQNYSFCKEKAIF